MGGIYAVSPERYAAWREATVKIVPEGEKKTASGEKYLDYRMAGTHGCDGHSAEGQMRPELLEAIRPGDVVVPARH